MKCVAPVPNVRKHRIFRLLTGVSCRPAGNVLSDGFHGEQIGINPLHGGAQVEDVLGKDCDTVIDPAGARVYLLKQGFHRLLFRLQREDFRHQRLLRRFHGCNFRQQVLRDFCYQFLKQKAVCPVMVARTVSMVGFVSIRRTLPFRLVVQSNGRASCGQRRHTHSIPPTA